MIALVPPEGGMDMPNYVNTWRVAARRPGRRIIVQLPEVS
jgi:hypothetical protein